MNLKFENNINFSKHYFKFVILSTVLLISLFVVFIFKGLNLGVDFKGGTLIEIRMEKEDTSISSLRDVLNSSNLGDVTVQQFGKKGDFLVKFEKKESSDSSFISELNEDLSNKISQEINFRRVENVGPKVSAELINKGILAISLALAAMLIYIWIRFEWQFSLAAIIALIHDVFITIGVFSLLSFEINLSIIAAILTIVGYSMNDTVVIFDRIRENLRKYNKITITEIVNLSTNETLSRTIITSVTTLLALMAIYLFGGEILKGFSFAMIFGVVIGTYSSIFIATPTLVYLKVSQKSVMKDKDN